MHPWTIWHYTDVVVVTIAVVVVWLSVIESDFYHCKP